MKNNYPLWDISLVVGFNRLATVGCQFFFGDLADKFSSKKILILIQVFCAILAYFIWLLWEEGANYFWYFVIVSSIRMGLVAVQNGPRGKLTKLFSTENLSSNLKTAAWLNKVTHGSFLVSSFLSVYLLTSHSFKQVIILDMVGFLLGGFLLLFINEEEQNDEPTKEGLLNKFYDLFKYAKKPAIHDLMLATSVTGLNMLTVRIVDGDHSKIPYFYAIYGLCVWLSGFFKGFTFFVQCNHLYWIGMGLSFGLVALLLNSNWLFVGILILYFSYWSIFHLITAQIQKDAPANKISGIVSARNILMLVVIATGEFAVGSIFSKISVGAELAIRATFCLLTFFFVMRSLRKV